jgi:hypothetical protein
MVTPTARRDAARHLVTDHKVSARRACGVLDIRRSSFYYEPKPGDDGPLREAIQQVAKERRRWGCPRIANRLRRQGWADNHKRIERIYREEKLQVRRRRRKRLSRGERDPLPAPTGPNQLGENARKQIPIIANALERKRAEIHEVPNSLQSNSLQPASYGMLLGRFWTWRKDRGAVTPAPNDDYGQSEVKRIL